MTANCLLEKTDLPILPHKAECASTIGPCAPVRQDHERQTRIWTTRVECKFGAVETGLQDENWSISTLSPEWCYLQLMLSIISILG